MKIGIMYNYDWWSFDKNLMKEFNWFLYKVNQRSNIENGFSDEVYNEVNYNGEPDLGLGYNVEYFHPTITLDDRMRFIADKIATADMSISNIIGNTLISHFYGARGIHSTITDDPNGMVDFDRVAENDYAYIDQLKDNCVLAKEKKLPIWGTTELHTSIQTASRNFCRNKYDNPERVFHTIDVIEWVASWRDSGFFEKMLECSHMSEIFKLLKSQPGIGEYYGFHAGASTSVLPQMKYHHDQRFVAPGPGAVRTIKTLWEDVPNKLLPEAVYFLRENQHEVGLTENVVFHEKAYNMLQPNGEKLFIKDQKELMYYSTEVLMCQYGVYLDIRNDPKACERRKVVRAQDCTQHYESKGLF